MRMKNEERKRKRERDRKRKSRKRKEKGKEKESTLNKRFFASIETAAAFPLDAFDEQVESARACAGAADAGAGDTMRSSIRRTSSTRRALVGNPLKNLALI